MGAEHVTLYGLHVVDPELYRQYRAAMEPLLRSAGGRFGYDFEVSRVLRSEVGSEINRVFTLCFASVEERQRFFARADYLAVRAAYFERAVDGVAELAAFTRSVAAAG